MSKKLLALITFGAASFIGGVVLLVFIIRARAVNIVSMPPAPKTAVVSSAATVASSAAIPSSPAVMQQGYIAGQPTRINIPSLGINLAVTPGYYDDSSQTWTLTTDKVQYAASTALPNNSTGNTFLYGHARTNIFGALPKIQSGALAIVSTNNGHRFYYTLSSTRVVEPTDVNAVFGYQGKPILTLQTCVGMLYQSRELLTFELERVV